MRQRALWEGTMPGCVEMVRMASAEANKWATALVNLVVGHHHLPTPDFEASEVFTLKTEDADCVVR